jgi:hypothetical protein
MKAYIDKNYLDVACHADTNSSINFDTSLGFVEQSFFFQQQ